MNMVTKSKIVYVVFVCVLLITSCSDATPKTQYDQTLTIMAHDSFAVSEEVISNFEVQHNTKVNILKDALKSYRDLIFSNSGDTIKTPVYNGNLLSNGHKINGPAVVEEDTTTLVIEPGWLLELHKSGTYIIKRKDH